MNLVQHVELFYNLMSLGFWCNLPRFFFSLVVNKVLAFENFTPGCFVNSLYCSQ